MSLVLNKIYNEDCLEGMKRIDDKSIDMILCDLPYGITDNKWDTVIPFEPLWEHYKRIIKDNGAIVLFAAQPFTSVLVNSNIKGYKHHWIWEKNYGTGFQVAKYRPMMATEDIIAFTKKGERINYYPIMIKRDKPTLRSRGATFSKTNPLASYNNNFKKVYTHKYPTNIIKIDKVTKPIHPTQKPVELFEYLIKAYTNKGETVLDNCMGSGTTAIACLNTNRNFIGFELDKGYFDIAKNRIEEEKNKLYNSNKNTSQKR